VFGLPGVVRDLAPSATRQRHLERQETERAECLHQVFHVLAERILFTLRNQSKSRVGSYAAFDKIVPVLVSDEHHTVCTGVSVNARGIGPIAVQPLDGSAEITW
jgi:hypothetical protein